MKKRTIMKIASVTLTVMLAVETCLMPEIVYASENTKDIMDSELGDEESIDTASDNNTNKARVLGCSLVVHTHSYEGGCYDAENNIICGYADYVIHTHDENCYEKGTLVCRLPEIEEHTHSKECYAQAKTEIIKKGENQPEEGTGIEESDNNITEGITEGTNEADDVGTGEIGDLVIIDDEPVPIKTSYNTLSEATICGKDEVELHIHGGECYNENGELSCKKLETIRHQHTDACFKTVIIVEEAPQVTNVSQVKKPAATNDKNAQYTGVSNRKTETPYWAFGVIILSAAAITGCCVIHRKRDRYTDL